MTKKQKILTIVSLIYNIAIVGFVAGAFIYSYFPSNPDAALMAKGIQSVRFYTVLSNLLLALFTLPALIGDIVSLVKKKYLLPSWVGVLKYLGTVGTTITFLTVVCFLAPVAAKNGQGYFSMFQGPNLYYHLIVPVLAILSFGFMELNLVVKMPQTPIGLSSVIGYGIFYVVNYYCHFIDDGNGSYDWYGFIGDSKRPVWLVAIIMLIASYVICIALYFLHRLFTGITVGKEIMPIEENSYMVDDPHYDYGSTHNFQPIYEEDQIHDETATEEETKEEPVVVEEKKKAPKTTKRKQVAKKVETPKEEKEGTPVVENKPVEETNEEIDIEVTPGKEKVSKSNDSKQNDYNGKARTYHISKVPEKGWQVKLATGKKAIKFFPTQKEAIAYAKSLSETQGGSIRIHSKKGKMRK